MANYNNIAGNNSNSSAMTLRGTPVYTTAPLAFTTAPVSSPFVLPFATAAPTATTTTSSTTATAAGMGGVFGSGHTAVLLTAPATTTPPSSAVRAQTMEAYMTAAPANILSSPHAAATATTTAALPYTAAFGPAAYAAYTHGVANGLLYTATPSLAPASAMGNHALTLANTAAAVAPTTTTSVTCGNAPQQYFATTPAPVTTTMQSGGDTASSKHVSHDSSSDGAVAAAAAADAQTTPPQQQQQQQPAPVTNLGTKLFVGQVPAVCTEEQLRPLFAEFGALIEVKIMREHNGRSKGSAWVRYESEDAARRAIAALHEKFVVPPQTNALRVQFASMSAPRRPRMPLAAMHNNAPAPASAPAGNSVHPFVQQQQQQLSSSPVAGGYTTVQHSSNSDKGYYGGNGNNAAVLKTAAAAAGGANIEQGIDGNGVTAAAARADGGGYSLATSAAMTSPYAPSMLAAHEQARLAQLQGASLVNGVLYTTLPATALTPAATTTTMATTTTAPTSVYGQVNMPSQPLQTAAPQTSMTAANNSSTALLNTLLLGSVGVPWQHGA